MQHNFSDQLFRLYIFYIKTYQYFFGNSAKSVGTTGNVHCCNNYRILGPVTERLNNTQHVWAPIATCHRQQNVEDCNCDSIIPESIWHNPYKYSSA